MDCISSVILTRDGPAIAHLSRTVLLFELGILLVLPDNNIIYGLVIVLSLLQPFTAKRVGDGIDIHNHRTKYSTNDVFLLKASFKFPNNLNFLSV